MKTKVFFKTKVLFWNNINTLHQIKVLNFYISLLITSLSTVMFFWGRIILCYCLCWQCPILMWHWWVATLLVAIYRITSDATCQQVSRSLAAWRAWSKCHLDGLGHKCHLDRPERALSMLQLSPEGFLPGPNAAHVWAGPRLTDYSSEFQRNPYGSRIQWCYFAIK